MSDERGLTLLVCGGRDFVYAPTVNRVLDGLNAVSPVGLVVTGGAPGADACADRWAESRGIDRIVCPANWVGRRSSAGPYRNRFMLEIVKPTLVVAFPGGRGTASMISLAFKAGVEVRCFPENIQAPDADPRSQRVREGGPSRWGRR